MRKKDEHSKVNADHLFTAFECLTLNYSPTKSIVNISLYTWLCKYIFIVAFDQITLNELQS